MHIVDLRPSSWNCNLNFTIEVATVLVFAGLGLGPPFFLYLVSWVTKPDSVNFTILGFC
uniref:Uncharacterized protein n=1 Tax=Rhizophora mucronata TaxID=61149 RepID=A0A2P2NR86_RHIMU